MPAAQDPDPQPVADHAVSLHRGAHRHPGARSSRQSVGSPYRPLPLTAELADAFENPSQRIRRPRLRHEFLMIKLIRRFAEIDARRHKLVGKAAMKGYTLTGQEDLQVEVRLPARFRISTEHEGALVPRCDPLGEL